jgi:hypothetical protein
MIDAVPAKVFGTKNKREIKAIQPLIAAINDLEPAIQQLSDIDLAAKTIEFKEKLGQGAPLDDLLIEAFAVVREAGRRFLGMRHFDVQLIGGIVCTAARSLKCAPVKEKRWSPPCPLTSTRSKAKASTSSPSTTTWPTATPTGWQDPPRPGPHRAPARQHEVVTVSSISVANGPARHDPSGLRR